MADLIHQPAPMSYVELAALLREIATHVETYDSWEGFVEYLLPDNPNHDVEVRARYRIGNAQGQGGMAIVGTFISP